MKTNIHQNNYFSTKDLAEASFLLVKGQRLIQIRREGKTCWFIFDGKDTCQELANSYWFGDCLIPSKSFYEAIQTLKNRIFSEQ